MFDLLVRGGVVVTPAGCERRDVGVEDGLIAAVETDLAGNARFALAGKGSLAPGADADLVLVELGHKAALTAEELLSRHSVNPFVGRRLRRRVTRTIVRGSTAYVKGDMVTPPGGRLLRPLRARSTEARS
jgi:dihydroorotase-like cyclic amidohydrolase